MSSISEYFKSLGTGIVSLVKGLQVTGSELVTPKITEFYPEDRDTYKWPERFRARLELIYDADGRHRCIACGTCERVCPNGTISLDIKTVESPEGKKKKKLAKYHYDLGTCTFCNLCVINCPTVALEFSNDFEQAVFTRDKLKKTLNDREDRQEDAGWPEASATPAAAPQASASTATAQADDATAKKVDALKKALAAKEAALAAATDEAEKVKIQAIIDKTKAAIAALAPAAPAVDPAAAKKIEALKKALAAKEAALAAATDEAEKAKIQAIIDKTKAAIAALGA